MKDTIKILEEITNSPSPVTKLYSLHPYDIQDLETLMYLANKIHSKIYK